MMEVRAKLTNSKVAHTVFNFPLVICDQTTHNLLLHFIYE